MVRKLLIATSPRLFINLEEQFAAVGGHELRAFADEGAAVAFEGPDDRPDAAVLDGAACDAAALARRLRGSGFAGTIVVVGAQAPEADAVLPRPFRFADLLAALKPAASRALGEFDGRLTEKEAAILDRLMRARGAIISKAELLAEVWGYGPNVSTRTLETHIHRLRRKIEADPSRPKKLLTEGGGYRIASAG